jgi:hypothetical protein
MSLLDSQEARMRASIITARGEYAQFMHMFLMRQTDSVDVPHVYTHHWYPWPFEKDIRPSLSHLQAWDHMGGFKHMPAQWASFWAELGVMRYDRAETQQPRTAAGLPYPDGALYGPYLMVLPFAHEAGLARLMLNQKNYIRTEMLRKGTPPDVVIPYMIKQFLDSIAVYKALTAEQEKDDENSRFGEGGAGSPQEWDRGAPGGPAGHR